MEGDLSRPAHERADESAASDAAKEPVRVATGPARCPFCHAAVALETQEWVACQGCLARHHATCWSENGACATCGCTKRFAPERSGKLAFGLTPAVVALFLVVLVLGGVVIDQNGAWKAEHARLNDLEVEARGLAQATARLAQQTDRLATDVHDRDAIATKTMEAATKSVEAARAGFDDHEARLRKLEQARGSLDLSSAGVPATEAGLAAIEEKQATEQLTMQVVFADQGTAKPDEAAQARKAVADELAKARDHYTSARRGDDAKRVEGARAALEKGATFEQVLEKLGAK